MNNGEAGTGESNRRSGIIGRRQEILLWLLSMAMAAAVSNIVYTFLYFIAEAITLPTKLYMFGLGAVFVLITVLMYSIGHRLAANRKISSANYSTVCQAAYNHRESFLAVTHYIDEAVIRTDTGDKIVYLNPIAEKLTGWSLVAALGHDLSEVVRLKNGRTASPVTGEISAPVDKEWRLVSFTGRETPVEVTIIPLKDENGQHTGRLYSLRDLTQHELNHDIIDFAGIGICSYNLNGVIRNIDRGTLKIFDLDKTYPDPVTVLGKKITDLIAPSDNNQRLFKTVLRGGNLHGLEYEITTLAGHRKWLRHDSRLTVEPESGDEIAQVLIRDVTTQRRNEHALKEKTVYLNKILESSQAMAIVATDANFRVKYFSPAAEEVFGYRADEVTGKSIAALHARERIDMARFDRAIENVNRGMEFKFTLSREIGHKTCHLEAHLSAIRSHRGRVDGYVLMALDITKRITIQDELTRRNQLLTDTIEAIPHPFYVIDTADYTLRIANSAARALTSGESDTCYSLFHGRGEPCHLGGHSCPLEQIKQTGRPVVMEHCHTDENGREQVVQMHGHPVFDESGQVVQIIEYALDITRRRQVENTLRLNREILERLADTENEAGHRSTEKRRLIIRPSKKTDEFAPSLRQVESVDNN